MIAIRGIGSNIAKEFIKYVDCSTVFEIGRNERPSFNVDRYLICQGYLCGKSRLEQTDEEIKRAYSVNYIQVAKICDAILMNNPIARICVIGSESGVVGSYDEVYADFKSLLHHYVGTKRIGPKQQLVCIAPSIIEDAGMTLRRSDVENLAKLRSEHPKGRFLTCAEIAEMIYFLLYVDQGYITGVVIRMNGGKHLL